jgi:hypothetical protein
MPQRSIRFPDELHDAIEAEATRRGHPHSFSSVLIEWATVGRTSDPISRAVATGRLDPEHEAGMREALKATPGVPVPLAASPSHENGAEEPKDLMKALKESLDASPRRHAGNCKCATCKPLKPIPRGTRKES